MPEAPAVELINLSLGEALDTIQWWASISIGTIALTYYWEERLTLGVVISVIVLYSLFSIYSISSLVTFIGTKNSYVTLLIQMREADELTVGGVGYLNSITATTPVSVTTYTLCTLGLYSGVITLLVIGYRRTRKPRD